MIAKIHALQGRKVLALCDKNLLGKRFEAGKLQLDLTSQFYKGDVISEKELLEILKDIYTVNAVGRKSIAVLAKFAVISKKNVCRIKGIPYANVILEF
ncbi:DUF424 family protein [Candidatus Woesearchaeota archaeon]|nr:DUF424 family protein [Candidatus Woesearchaeota archaeon]